MDWYYIVVVHVPTLETVGTVYTRQQPRADFTDDYRI